MGKGLDLDAWIAKVRRFDVRASPAGTWGPVSASHFSNEPREVRSANGRVVLFVLRYKLTPCVLCVHHACDANGFCT